MTGGQPHDGDSRSARPAAEAASPAEEADPTGRLDDLERALRRLPEIQRWVLCWRHQEQLPFAEIAHRLDLPLAEAQAVWFDALEALTKELELSP